MWSCHEESFCIDLSNLASLIVHKLHQLSGLSTYSFTPAAVFSSLASTAIPLSCSIQARQMVALSDVRASNAQISTSLPHGLVAIFIGGTSGIGEYTLKQFARNACQPRIYNIGRSRKASERIEAECLKLNSDVQYTFIQADVSLIKNVDTVCETIRHKEDYVNILFLSAGTLMRGEKTEEGLHLAASLKHYSRVRFIRNLLPSLQAATSLRRVISVLCGTKEGHINLDDIQGWDDSAMDLFKQRGHSSSLVTLMHARFATEAPTVSFVHDYPGHVNSNIARGTTGVLSQVMGLVKLLGPLVYIPEQESGERHLYFATSARFKAKEGIDGAIPLTGEVTLARGIDGVEGSGVYSADQVNETAKPAVEELLTKYIAEGYMDKIWAMFEEEYKRIADLPRRE